MISWFKIYFLKEKKYQKLNKSFIHIQNIKIGPTTPSASLFMHNGYLEVRLQNITFESSNLYHVSGEDRMKLK